jgi:hypothetical protein
VFSIYSRCGHLDTPPSPVVGSICGSLRFGLHHHPLSFNTMTIGADSETSTQSPERHLPDGIFHQFSESGGLLLGHRVLRLIKTRRSRPVRCTESSTRYRAEDSIFPDTIGYTRTHDGGHPSLVTCSIQTERDGIARHHNHSLRFVR